MNLFESNILPSLWAKAVDGNINSILMEEILLYHEYAKQPDTGENFRRFYSHIEPLHSFLAQKAAKELSYKRDDSSNDFSARLEIFSNSLGLRQFFKQCNKIVVLKGGIDLAHGDVLKKQIRNLSQDEICCTGLILIDYPPSNALSNLFELGIKNLSLGHLSNLKDRYALISYGLLKFTGESRNEKEIIWWGIPFGMIFSYQLAINLATQSGSFLSCKRSYVTVKHHHTFSNKYIDKIYTSTPGISGFCEIYKPEVASFTPSFYDSNVLISNASLLSEQENLVLTNLRRIKANGAQLFSSASRVEKTCDVEYLNVIEGILTNIKDSVLVCFGKSLPPQYQLLIDRFGNNRIFFAGWRTPSATVKIIGLLDLFLDPFPFGAGMTFASAGYQRIPIISTGDFVKFSPSSISILYYYCKSNHLFFDKGISECLFGSTASILKRSIYAMENKERFAHISAKIKNIIEDVFINPRATILSQNTP